MAACTELEIEEKSSEESSRSIVNSNDSAFYNVSSGTRYNAAWNANTEKELGAQLQVESETGDLKELSDDEFLHLLKEASTFNKPNNQESILLKQLRKEVAESDSCENVSRGETGPVTRVDRKCSKIVYGSSCSESSVSSHTSAIETIPSALPAQTFSRPVQRKLDRYKEIAPVLLSVTEGNYVKCSQVSHHIVEVETNNNQSLLKTLENNPSHLQSLKNCSDTKGQCENDTSSTVHSSVVCDFTKSSSDWTDLKSDLSGRCSGGVQEKDRNETISSNMVKLENEHTSSLAISDCEELVNEPVTDKNHITNSSLVKEAQEVEMMEIRRSKDGDSKDRKNETSVPDKRQVSSEMTSSKFYVNCNDVDTTVTFPLKLVSSGIDDRNSGGIICDAVNEQLKRQMNFPCFSWPRAQQVHSFLGSLPVDHEALQSQNDSGSAGNPFTRGAHTANITSFVSATLLDYPTTTLMTESQSSKFDYTHRKHKRTRNNAENGTFILAENIAGHRGNEDIDSLVKFIEAADKNDKVFTRGSNSSNQLLKNNSTPDVLSKRKVNGRDSKINHSKNGSSLKKKLDDNCNHGNNKLDNLSFENKILSSESESSDDSTYTKLNKVSPEHTECGPYLDINSNVMDNVLNYCEVSTDKEVVNVVEAKLDLSAAECISPHAYVTADFHVISETTSQPIEESGFRIVKKKQRKRHQGKRSENYRWHSAAARVRQSTSGDHDYYSKEQTQRGMLLSNIPLAQRNQCGKQDSRRKSTSSVPHSEQSSADNSDLDSVHSLPVRGSAPHPTKTHPHTTPSSSSSTPQASYADIARMPVSSVSKQNSVVTATAAPSMKFSSGVERREIHSEVVRGGCMDKNIDLCAPHTVRLNESGEPCAIKNSPASVKSTREINTQTEPFVSDEGAQNKNDFIPASNLRKSSCVNVLEDNKNYQKCTLNCKSKNCIICSKSDKLVASKQDSNDRLHRPAVVMMGNIPAMEASDISFGIDLKEILQISAGENTDLDDSGVTLHSCLSDAQCSEHQCDTYCDVDQQSNTKPNKSSFGNYTVNKCDASEQVSTLKKPTSSPCNELRLASGQRLQFTEEIVDMQKFNYTQIVDLFAREWKNVQIEYNSEINKTGEKVKYYEDSC